MSFRFVNAVVNPLTRTLLRSPLHRVASAKLMLITFTGRRTGTRHTIPVQYAQDDEGIVVVVGWPEQKVWWRNLLDGGEVEMRVRGRRIEGHAQSLRGRDDPDRVAAALRRYVVRLPKAAKQAPPLADAVVVLVSPRS